MTKKEIAKRYLIFLFGLFFSSLGISFVTKATLGTSPISSIPYVLSLGFQPTLGQFTIVFSLFLIILQVLVLRKKFQKHSLLQIPVSILFGYFIDGTMLMLGWLAPSRYGFKVLSLLVGCVILGLGVYFEVIANVVMLPGEAFVKAVTIQFHTDFGFTKVCFDATMTVTAGIISAALFHRINGVREGTLIAALLVGLIAKFWGKHLHKLTELLLPENSKGHSEPAGTDGAQNIVITISREYGSGGREVGKKVADKLGIAYYDGELITLAAMESGYTEEFVAKSEQTLSSSLLRDWFNHYYVYSNDTESKYDVLFQVQQKVIKELAEQGPCVIVGRMANYALKDYKKAFHVFVGASLESKIHHVMEREGLNRQDAEKKIIKSETERKHHCKHYTGTEWGFASNYDITIRSDRYSHEEAADIIADLARRAHQMNVPS